MGHSQGTTPLQFDNKCGHVTLTGVLKQRKSKGMDMQVYWLRDRSIEQKQLHTHWKRGKHSLGDYPTKHHPSKHHRNVPPLYLSDAATKYNKFLATVINQLYSVCKGVLNTNSQMNR